MPPRRSPLADQIDNLEQNIARLRARLAAVADGFEPPTGSVLEEAELTTALHAAELEYGEAIAARATDDSKAARERCAQALEKWEHLQELAKTLVP